MLEASETRKRFVVEDGKMKCNLAGRTRGKRCGSTLMIDRSIACSAGHKFTLDELVAGSLKDNPHPLVVRALLATAMMNGELAGRLAKVALEEKFSPPYSIPGSGKDQYGDNYHIHQWMDNNPWEFGMLLQLAEWHHPDYAEALRGLWIERSDQKNEIVDKAIRKLEEESRQGNFQSRMRRDHMIDLAREHSWDVTVQRKATQYYLMVESLKITGDTEFLWLYEDSLRELSMITREKDMCPIVFSGDSPSTSDMRFTMYLRRPEVGANIIDGQVQIRMDYSGFTHFEVYSGQGFSGHPAPSINTVERALEKKLRNLCGREGKVLEVISDDLIRLKDSVAQKEHWQLEALADLRHWLCYFEVESAS